MENEVAKMADQNALPQKSLVDILPSWILATTGVIYAAGFLVVLAFLDRYGIREAGSDFWKARYIHIGILCLSFPVILNGTILSLVHLIFHGKFDKPAMWQRIMPIGFLAVNLEILCFILIMMTNKTQSGGIAGFSPIQWILSLTLLGVPLLLVVERVIEKVAGNSSATTNDLSPITQSFTVNARWLLVVVVACLDVWFFLDFRGVVSGIQPSLALAYIGFSILLGVIISTISIYEQRQSNEGRRRAIAVLSSAIIGPFLYLIVLSFSYGVFQNIPATRGGGDYTESPKVVLTFKEKPQTSSKDARYFDGNSPNMTIPLVLIEETSWAFYLADPKESGGPSEWKSIGGIKPEIFIVNKSIVTKIHSESRNSSKTLP